MVAYRLKKKRQIGLFVFTNSPKLDFSCITFVVTGIQRLHVSIIIMLTFTFTYPLPLYLDLELNWKVDIIKAKFC